MASREVEVYSPEYHFIKCLDVGEKWQSRYHRVFHSLEAPEEVGMTNGTEKLCQLVLLKNQISNEYENQLCLYPALLLVKMKNGLGPEAVYCFKYGQFWLLPKFTIPQQKNLPASKIWDIMGKKEKKLKELFFSFSSAKTSKSLTM